MYVEEETMNGNQTKRKWKKIKSMKPTVCSLNTIKLIYAPAGAAQWTEHQPANQRVAGSVSSQGTCLSCGPGPQRRACERQPHVDVSLLVFLPPCLSL